MMIIKTGYGKVCHMSMMVVVRQRIIAFHNEFSSFESGWPGWFRVILDILHKSWLS